MTEKTKNERILEASLHRIIDVNRESAEKDGDANKAEAWASTIVAREVLDFIDTGRGNPRLTKAGYNLNGFYYRFIPTGVPSVDAILHSIISAVNAQSDVSRWNKPVLKPKECDGETPFDWIQNAADSAALEVQRNDYQELIVFLSQMLLASDSSTESMLDKDPVLKMQLQKISASACNKNAAERGLTDISRRPTKERQKGKRISSILAQYKLEKFIYDEDIDDDDALKLRVLMHRDR